METSEIIDILAVEPYRILTRWSNGEIRQNDYTAQIAEWRQSENPMYRQLSDWNNFRQVVNNDGVLSWPSVRVEFNLGDGPRNEPFEFDPITTYEASQLLTNTIHLDESVGRTLVKARQQANLTQEELARRIGSSKQYISKIERGVVQPQTDTLQRIAAAMGRRVALV